MLPCYCQVEAEVQVSQGPSVHGQGWVLLINDLAPLKPPVSVPASREGALLLLGLESHAPHIVSTDSTGKWSALLSPAPCLLWHHLAGFEAPHYSLAGVRVHLCCMGDMGPQCFLCCLAEVERLLFYAVCLGRLPFLGPLAERTGFLSGLFPSAYTGIFGLPGTPEPSLGYMRQKKNSRSSLLLFIFLFFGS